MYVCMYVCMCRPFMGPDHARPSLSLLELFCLAPCLPKHVFQSMVATTVYDPQGACRDNLGFQDPQDNMYAPHIKSQNDAALASRKYTHTTSSVCTIPQQPAETPCVSKIPRTICMCAPHIKSQTDAALASQKYVCTRTQLQVCMGINAETN